MPERIHQCFAADTVDLITNHRMQRPNLAFHHYAKIKRLLNREFLWDAGECLFEVAPVRRRSKASQGIPAIVNHKSHQIEDAVVVPASGRRLDVQHPAPDMLPKVEVSYVDDQNEDNIASREQAAKLAKDLIPAGAR